MGRPISGSIDDALAERLETAAREEGRASDSLVVQAVDLYTGLPEMARSCLRRVETEGSDEEKRRLRADVVRVLLGADMALTQRHMAEEIGRDLPEGDSEADIECAALDWTTPTEK
jgi:hypothetical protein